jgi:hypothetical protein
LEKLTKRNEAELRLIAELTFDATIAAEAKLAKLAKRVERSSAPRRAAMDLRDERTCVSDGATAPSDMRALTSFTSSSSIGFP